MKEALSLELLQRFICSNISIFILLGFIPALRNLFGFIGIGVCSFGLSLYLARVIPSSSYFEAVRASIFVGVPFLISYELIAATAKSLEILRGSQMAEQLFIQERGGPIEFFLLLLFGSLFLSNGGGEFVLSQFTSHSTHELLEGDRLQVGYHLVLSKVFALASLGIVLEVISGVIQRVSKKAYLGAEVSTFRIPITILLLVTLLEEVM